MVDLDPPCRIHVLFTCVHKSAGVVKPNQLKWPSVWITKFSSLRSQFSSHVGCGTMGRVCSKSQRNKGSHDTASDLMAKVSPRNLPFRFVVEKKFSIRKSSGMKNREGGEKKRKGVTSRFALFPLAESRERQLQTGLLAPWLGGPQAKEE